jgi:hypothetical protein
MTVPLRHLLGWLIAAFPSHQELVLENLALRQQLFALHTKRPRRRLGILDKFFWVVLRRVWSGWRRSLILVTPDTVVRWHQAGFACTGTGSREQDMRLEGNQSAGKCAS